MSGTGSPIETDGNVALYELSSGLYELDDNGTCKAIKNQNGDDVGADTYSGWSAVEVIEDPDGTGYRLLWQNTDGTYSDWTLDSSGQKTSGGTYDPASGGIAAIETVYGEDLNGDGIIGDDPDATIIENNGVALWESLAGDYSLDDGGTVHSITDGSGDQVGADTYGGWSAVEVVEDPDGPGYRLLWQNTDGTYSDWTLDSSGQKTAGTTYDPADGGVVDLEKVYDADLNGDGTIGDEPDATVIEADGVELWESLAGDYSLNDSGATTAITDQSGDQVGADSYGGWSAAKVVEDPDGAGYRLLWEHTDGSYSDWTLDGSGQKTGGDTYDPASGGIAAIETVYDEDLNGDGIIGDDPDATVIESTGVELWESLIQSDYSLHDAGTTKAITDQNGDDVGADTYSGWSAKKVTVDPDGTGYRLLWEHDDGRYSDWTLDSSGQKTAGETFQSDDDGVVDREEVFGCDLNGDGQVGRLDLLFNASRDGGEELFATDGTLEGTRLVKDINPGADYSGPANFVASGDIALLSATTTSTGRELWMSDGTESGTNLLKDINVGSSGSFPFGQTVVEDQVLFGADDAIHGRELWSSDGSTAGTQLLKDINPSGGASLDQFTGFGQQVIFTADDGVHGDEIWSSDGTTGGTQLLKDINPGSDAGAPSRMPNEGDAFAVADGTVFFRADDSTTGAELWKTDGTTTGTQRVEDIYDGASGSSPRHLTAFGDRVLFEANDGEHGEELWISDGTESGTRMLRNINDVGDSVPLYARGSSPREFGVLGDQALFAASDGSNGEELWITDGTTSGTEMVADINSGTAESSYPREFTVLGDKAVFQADDETHGDELWITDGTAAGTKLLADIWDGQGGSTPNDLKTLGDQVLFGADDGSLGRELWTTDGTASGTELVADIDTTVDMSGLASSYPAPGDGVLL